MDVWLTPVTEGNVGDAGASVDAARKRPGRVVLAAQVQDWQVGAGKCAWFAATEAVLL